MTKSYKQLILIFSAVMLGAFAMSADSALAATTMGVKNTTTGHATYSLNSTYADSVRAEPGDTLEFQMVASGAASTGITVVLPANLTYTTTSSASTGAVATVNVSGQTIDWTYPSTSAAVIRFTAAVASGSTLSTSHNLSVAFTTNTALTSTATVTIGPIITSASPSTGGDLSAVDITLTGHGFTQVGDISSVVLRPTGGGSDINIVQSLAVSSVGSGLYTITGVRVNSGTATGSYYIIVATSGYNGTAYGDSVTLSTNADTTETVNYTVSDGTSPVMSSANSYAHSTGVLSLTFNETIDVSATDLSKITLYDAAAAGNSQALTGATVSTADSTAVTITLTQAQKNTVSGWGVTAGNLYVQIAGSGIFDLSSNNLAAQGSRTAISTWTKDTTAPTATLAYTQNSASATSVKAGDVTVTATFSEPISATPNIAIDQPGATNIAATAMTLPSGGDRTTWTYTYTINAEADGTATVTLTNAPDYANNVLGTVTGNTFTLDTLGPTPAISTLATPTSSTSSIDLTWTPTYTASDFSAYKIYYRASAGVTSSNGALISVGGSSTGSYSVTGLNSGATYYFVIYICDQAGNCSSPSNEASRATGSSGAIIITAPSGGGGSAPSAPTTSSTSGSVDSTGGTITNTTANGTTAAVTIPANTFTSSTAVTASEATTTEKQNASIAATLGTVLGSSVFSLQATSNGTAITSFSQAVTLEFTYTTTDLGTADPATLRLAYYDTATHTWVALDSTVDPVTRKVRAQTTHFTLFAIVSFVSASTGTTGDTGQVLGSSVGAYPNGVLLKAPDAPTVWQIAGGAKHAVPSPAVFATRFSWDNIVRLPSSRQLDLYERGQDVKFAPNTLVKIKGAAAVYRVSSSGGLQPIISGRVFLDRFYQWSDVIEVSASLLADYPREELIADAQTIYDAELVAVPQAGVKAPVYYVTSGTVREFPNNNIFLSHALKLKRIRAISKAELSALTRGEAMTYADGTLLKGKAAAVYIISDGQKRPIKSAADFTALLFDWKKIKLVSDTLLSQITTAGEIRLVDAKSLHLAAQ